MQLPRWLVTIFLTGLTVLAAGATFSQNYPTKPIRIVTADAGGGLDFSALVLAQGLTRELGQRLIVDNRGGGSGSIAADTVAKAQPDGYTLLYWSSSFWFLPFLRDLPYDPLKDFTAVTLALMSPDVVAVHPAVPVNTVKELIALAKAKPGELNYASSGAGSSTHLAAELFKIMAGLNIVHVPYKGGGPAITALIGGQVQLMIQTAPAVTSHVKAGRLKALAVTSAEPSRLVPGLPTMASTIPGFQSGLFTGFYAPARTPATIIDLLQRKTAEALNIPEIKEKFFNAGSEVIGSTPQTALATMKAEMARMGKVIKDANIRAD